jgi:predicted transposase YbfD/YdcC
VVYSIVNLWSEPMLKLIESFTEMPDPRVVGRTDHHLVDILVLTVCAVLCGADDWEAVEMWGEAKLDWLRQFIPLKNGIPSHDTLGRVFAALDSTTFQACFTRWVATVCGSLAGQVVAIDGKTMRGSHHHRLGKKAIHMVSAFASDQGITLGQLKTEEKSNEITAIPELLAMLALKDSIVTIDSMGCQKDIAAAIIAKEAHYVLALKGNHGKLHEQVAEFFDIAGRYDYKSVDARPHVTCEKEHGRIESRRVIALSATHLEGVDAWSGLNSMIMVESMREIGDKRTAERRFYISSLPPDSKQIGDAIRAHWGIENRLHWCLDVTFKEDGCRIRTGHAAENLNIVRKITMNLLRQDTSMKRSIPKKRLYAALHDEYLASVLGLGAGVI